jgi:sugar O-acyltransferase (sialic acid O-acetyltransferase NeuD family)
MAPLLICGTRSFAEEVADLAEDAPGLELAGFVENWERERASRPLLGKPVHWVDDIAGLAASHRFLCALVTTQRIRFTAQMEGLGFSPATLLHPAAHVSSRATLEAGVIASPGVVVGAHARVDGHTILNRGVLVGHHTQIGDHASLLPGVNVAGNCDVGAGTFLGMGALVLNDLTIGEGAVIAAGSIVTRDVPTRTKVMGAPARVVEEQVERR